MAGSVTSVNQAEPYDLIVIGAGAAGLLAAGRAAEHGRRTLLIEKNRKPGVKILISGGTRCNLTHDCDPRGIVAAFGSAGSFLHSALAALDPRQLIALIEAEGVATKVEPGGKVFPRSDRALDVVQALVARLARCGAELALAEPVERLERHGAGFLVHTARRTLACDKLLVTTGGRSYPGCGTTGDGYRWLAQWGHTIRPPRPALVPLVSDDAWIRALSGITLPDVVLKVVDPAAATAPASARQRRLGLGPGVLIERRGALLFTHFGLSGPAALDVSRAVTGAGDPRRLALVVDLFPDRSEGGLDEQFRAAAARDGKKQVLSLVPAEVQRRLAEALLALAGIPLDRRAAELTKAERAALTAQLKHATIHVSGSRGFDKAEVTAGGVELSEVDSRSMQSKLVPNLYLAGEILDLDGFIGGYNFQAAFSTGWLAAQSA